MTALLVALGAALGGPLRYAWAVTYDGRWPAGTQAVNTVGSGLIGFFAALSLSDQAWALFATGFCGAFTSYSAFAVQAEERGLRLGGLYAVSTVLLAVAACALGYWLGGVATAA